MIILKDYLNQNISIEEKLKELSDKGYMGLNITQPYKEEIFQIISSKSEEVKLVQSINTVMIDNSISAYNTDYLGFRHILKSNDIQKLAEDAFDFFLKKRHEIKLFPGVEDVIKNLSKNHTLGVLTNGNADIYKLNIGKYFKFSISSLEAQDSKPNKSHFELAKNKLVNITYNEMLHIGDHQINDILGAHSLGINVLWFNNNEASWNQNFEKPEEFSNWQNLENIIKEKYESR